MKCLIVLEDLAIDNGVTSLIMQYYDGVLEHRHDIDFLVMNKKESKYVDYISKHSTIYVMPSHTNKFKRVNYMFIKKIIDSYDVVHLNVNGLYALIITFLVKKKKIIYHAHNPKETSSLKAMIRTFIYENNIVRRSENYLACSCNAGDSVFGKKKYFVLKNAVNYERFKYNELHRLAIRNKYDIKNDDILIGIVARFAEQKNPDFIINFITYLVNKNSKFKLIWCGEGPLKDSVIYEVKKRKISENCFFVDKTETIEKIYSAMDVFFLPSIFEGFGLVLVEAQVNGLPCLVSDNVTKEINISNRVKYVSLKEDFNLWEKNLMYLLSLNRVDENDKIDYKYDIKNQKYSLASFYESIKEE